MLGKWDNDEDCLADEFAAKRGSQLQQAIRKHGKCSSAALPVAFLENSDKCKQNDTGEKVLQNGEAWLPQLMDKVYFYLQALGNVSMIPSYADNVIEKS